MLRRVVSCVCAAILFVALAPPARAGSLTTSVIGMFPKDIGQFVYVDLKTARRYSWFAQFKDQVVPSRFRQFEKFLAAAGIDPDSQVDELAWAAVMSTARVVEAKAPPKEDAAKSDAKNAPAKDADAGEQKAPPPETGEQVVGIALGNFSPSAAEGYFTQQKLPVVKVRGFSLFGFGSGSGPNDIFFFFIDSNTAAFGHRQLLEKLIEVRFGGEESLLRNDRIFPLIDEINGHGLVWAAMDESYTRLGVNQLLPEAAQFPDAGKLFARVKAMTMEVMADHGVDARLNAVCGSVDDANTLAQLMQAGLLYRRYQEAQTNPDLAKAIDSSTVGARGDRLQVGFTLTDDLLVALLRRNTFAVKM